jgi:hypothetical protein
MVEWTNPIFYINMVGLVVSIVLFLRTRGMGAWNWAMLVFVIGTGLHFIGDLIEFDENADHIFIHAVVAVALLVPLIKGVRAD